MELRETGSQVTEVLGDRYPCYRCHAHKCTKGQILCENCHGKCLVCQKTPAAEICAPCAVAKKKTYEEQRSRHGEPHALHKLLAYGSADAFAQDAKTVLRMLSLPERPIREAAGGGSAGGFAVKRAAVATSAWLAEKTGAERQYISLTRGRKPAKTHLGRPQTRRLRTDVGRVRVGRSRHRISTSQALTAVDAIGGSRAMVPAISDVPLHALTIASEYVEERLGRGDLDAVTYAKVANTVGYVHEAIVSRARRQMRSGHVETLETFARAEAERAVTAVLGDRRLPQNRAARHAAETPKKRKAREKLEGHRAKRKASIADGTHKPVKTGDTKNYFKTQAKFRDRHYQKKLAYNKVERLGPGACRPHEVEKHAAYKAMLEEKKARNAARKGKK